MDRLPRRDDPGRIACHHRARRHVFRHHAAGTYERVLTDGYAAQECGTRADGRAALDQRRNTFPIGFRLQTAIRSRGTGKAVVGERDIVADENLIFQGHAFADERVAGNLATVANF